MNGMFSCKEHMMKPAIGSWRNLIAHGIHWMIACLLLLATSSSWAATVTDGFDPNVTGQVYSMALQADGKTIIGGQFTYVGGTSRNNIARLNVDGTLDTTFTTSANNYVFALAVQPDGKILVGGDFTDLGGGHIVRLNSNGSVDSTFSNPLANAQVNNIALQSDGKILIGGIFTTLNGVAHGYLARLNADGSVDSGFNPNVNSQVSAITLQPDGKILIGGLFTNKIARLMADGSNDTSFNISAGDNYVSAIALQADGKILVGGAFTTFGGAAHNYLVRLNSANGSVDTAFTPNLSGGNQVISLGVQADGKVIIGGFFSTVGGTPRSNIARLNAADGSVDAGFDPKANSAVYSIIQQPDGNILIGGTFTTLQPNGAAATTTRNNVARLYPDGSLDATLNPNANGSVYTTLLQPDGKILVGGSFGNIGGQARFYIARLNPDGTADSSFLNPNANARAYSLALQPDGKILVGGEFTSVGGTARNYIARLNPDGTLDATFAPNSNNFVYSIFQQSDGMILVGGMFTNIGGQARNRIARLNSDGTADAAFDPNASSTVNSVVQQADGKILVGGQFTTIGGLTRNRIARLNLNGTADASFDPNANTIVQSFALQPDGKIIVGGQFSSIGGQTRNSIARLKADGTVDTSFPDLGANGWIGSLTLQADGKILVGGAFAVPMHYICRLNADGTLDATFNPDADNVVYSVALQPDGKILVGGSFSMIGGQSRSYFARLSPDVTASQELTISADGTTVNWMRSGSSPELFDITFEHSADMSAWTALGSAVRISGGWQLTGLLLPSDVNHYVRARGKALGGFNNGTTSLLESVRQYYNMTPPDTIPDPFTFTSQSGIALNTAIMSDTVTVTGINAASSISITGGEYRINGGAWTTASGSVSNNDTVTVRLTSASIYSTATRATLTIGGVSAQFSVTTMTIPTYTITASAGAGGSISPSGSVSVTQGGSQTFTITPSSGYSVSNVLVDGVSVGTATSYPFTNVTANHTISVSFSAAADTTPDPFTFTSQSGVALNTVIQSNNITVTGINAATPVSITGGECMINSGAWTSSSGTVNNNDTVAVRQTSASTYSTATGATLTIGGVSAQFTVTTMTLPAYTLNFVAGLNGSLSGTTSQTVNSGGSAGVVTATADSGYHFINWTGDNGFVTTTANPLTVSNVSASQTIVANFAIDTPALPDGHLATSSTESVSIADALVAMQIAIGAITPTAEQLRHGDVAPLVNGKRAPNGRIDLGDAVVLLRRAVGLLEAW